MKKLIAFAIIYVFVFGLLFCQQDLIHEPEIISESVGQENYLSDNIVTENEITDDALFTGKTLDINSATKEQLLLLPGITHIQVASFMEHRKKYGYFMHVFELQALEHWNVAFIGQIIGLIECLPPVENLLSTLKSSSNNHHTLYWRFGTTLQKPDGYLSLDSTGPAYLGDRSRHLIRWRYQKSTFVKAGVTLEKDAGEQFVFTGKTPLAFDYFSWYIQIKSSRNIIRNLITGDFSIHLGQGLIRSNAFGGMSSSQVLSLIKEGQVIRPNTSVQESNAYRGIGVILNSGSQTELALFASFKKADARTSLSRDSTETIIHSLLYDGYHRTANEWEHRQTTDRIDIGFSLKRHFKNLTFSSQTLATRLSGMLTPAEAPHNTFEPGGNTIMNASVDYIWYFRNILAFGEAAVSANGGIAILQGWVASPDKKTEISVVWRQYGKTYQALQAQSFGVSQDANNESGLFASLQVKPVKNWSIALFSDLYAREWPVFGTDGPGFGGSEMLKISFSKRKKYNAYIQYQHKWKMVNQGVGNINQSVENTMHRLRAHIDIHLYRDWEFRSRIEWNYLNTNITEAGFLMLQDVIYRPEGKPFSGTLRYAIFDSEDFANRIYAYENNLLFSASTTFYYGKGSRFYLNWRWKVNKLLTIELRYASTWQMGAEELGSGAEKINGNQKSEIAGQLRLTL
jgi:hypothetical protein